MTYQKYLLNICIFVTTICIFVGLGNYYINPFNIFNVNRIDGINIYKPEAPKRIRIYKKYESINYQPSVLIVGNSRVEMGLSPDNELLRTLGNAYNLGIPGMRFIEQAKYVNMLIEQQKIEHIIIGIDFSDYLFRFDEIPKEYLGQKSLKSTKIFDYFSALWSLDALNGSVITLLNQNELSSTRNANGFNPANDYIDIINNEGQDVLFRQKLSDIDNIFADKFWVKEMPSINADFKRDQNIKEHIDKWKKLGIEVYVFINPYHQLYYDKLKEHELFDSFLRWKTFIINELKSSVPFCDFTELGKAYSEHKLASGDFQYFWEPSHYKKEFGDMLIPEIINGCS